MGQRFIHWLLGILALLIFSAAYSDVPLNINASLDSFSYDLDSASLKLEKLDSNWQFLPTGDKQLVVEQLKAKRLTITLKPNPKPSNGLPKDIKLPFPIRVMQSQIQEVIVLNNDTKQIFNNVQLQFDGNDKSLTLHLQHANTPWGEVSGNLNMATKQPFALDGTVAIKQLSAKHSYELTTQWQGNLGQLQIKSDLWIEKPTKDAWLLSSKRTSKALAKVQLQAQISTLDEQPFSGNAVLSELDPTLLAHLPANQLNLSLDFVGQMQPHLSATLQADAINSVWNQHPVVLKAEAKLLESAIESMNIEMRVGNNQLTGHGRVNAQELQLDWQSSLADLSILHSDYAGQMQASGSIAGPISEPVLNINISADELLLAKQTHIQQLKGHASIDLANQGKLAGNVAADKVSFGKQAPLNLQLGLEGIKENHQLQLNVQGQNLKLDSLLHGGLYQADATAPMQWRGSLEQFNFSGLSSVKLNAPAPLQINSSGILLGQTALSLAQGSVLIDYLDVSDASIKSKGKVSQVGIKNIPPSLMQWPENLQGNPIFSGDWEISALDTLNAKLQFKHESGDLSYKTHKGTSQALDIQKAEIHLNIAQNQAQLSANIASQHVGQLDIQMNTVVSKLENRFSILPDAPLTLQANGTINTLAWLPMPVAMVDATLDGQLNISAKANGTRQAPNLSGALTGENIVFQLASEGIAFTQGKVQASFEGNRLSIQEASWVGGKGQLSSSGWLSLVDGKPSLALDWKAEKFTALSRTDRLLTLSGQGSTLLSDRLLSISGNVTVDEGLIELSSEDTPTLGNDVVVLGQEVEDASASVEVLLNNLRIQLGEQFSLRGRGLDATLTGGIALNGLTNYHPHAQGSIQVSKGTFMAYGQVLSIERGILNFSGVMDNPGLDIRAMRNSKPINAGVEITGNAFNPATKLVSDPNVAESEKLSWLVLGHGLESAGKNDYGMLSLAAGVLLSQGQSVPLQTQLARAAGLDEFSFTGGDVDGASLTLGKRITSQIYLSYAKSITGLLDVARLTYNITPRWLLRAEAGTESAVDVLYTFSFK